ncbi:metallophosphoesterase [Actinoplanes bogorensis]|uniref:Metallophosphoesterase n=1 Tax=Paractinoplanes bogorensis TaxID=1610840 RepID=A0ABS5YNP8_9ACTN|nr:metallophosphoesterase [Actinoplanes bogorensis]MBU2665080.1 metallophosphoesterase [Actinoplanes bogorensis]
MRLLHLSDTHLTATPGPARDSLRHLLDSVRPLTGLDAVVVTGDVADDGSRAAYEQVRALIGELGLPVLWTTGNHDERTAFAAVLGDDLVAAHSVRGHRIITLDTLVPGEVWGELDDAQLAWLRAELATPAPHGTVLAFHHPPIALPGFEVQEKLGLRNPEALADAIRGSDVRLILTGHFHLQLFGLLESVPVWVTPGVVNRIDLTAPAGVERAVRGASATLVDLSRSPMMHLLHARDPHTGETLHEKPISDLIARYARP